jgi:hypothetical protein
MTSIKVRRGILMEARHFPDIISLIAIVGYAVVVAIVYSLQ